ncbi:tyrosine-type recombinase/integrase [Acetobacter sp.]|uniref:tyrosine-type recombinase/integrase n=1 Tax=Acetobacter sp. TaxID=440 RepID=UPI0039EB4188
MSEGKFRIGEYFLDRRKNSQAWCACYYEPKTRQTKRTSLRTTVFHEAQIKLAEYVAEHSVKRKVHNSDATMATIFFRYFKKHSQQTRSAQPNYRALQLVLDCLKPNYTVADYTISEQRRISEYMRSQGYSAGYTRRIMGIAAAAINWAWKNGEIERQIPIVLPPDGAGRERIMTIQEMARLWDVDMPSHLRMFLALIIGTASRPEALLELTREQCDLQHGVIDLNPPGRPRTKKRRPRVPMPAFLRPWIETVSSGHLVTYKSKPILKINGAWRAAREAAGLSPEIVPYTVRHTMATELITRGVAEIEVASLMGHAMPNLRTTGRYVHVRPDFLANARQAIEEVASAIDRVAARSMVNLNLRANSVLDSTAKDGSPMHKPQKTVGFLPDKDGGRNRD